MTYRAAARFHFQRPGERPGRFYNPGEDVPDDVASQVDARCIIEVSSGMQGYPADGTIDEVAGWILEAGDEPAEVEARAEYARGIEQQGGNRKGLLSFITDTIATLTGGADEDE